MISAWRQSAISSHRLVVPTFQSQRRFAQIARLPTIRTHIRTHFAKVDYESKYADKLKKMADRKGVSVEELKKQRLDIKKPTQISQPKPSVPRTTKQSTASHVAHVPTGIPESSSPTLDKIVKLDLLEKEDPETVGKIWTEYHANKDCITAVIPSNIYDKQYKRSQEYPMFIVPMPREEGIEFFFMQFNFHQCNFTSLLEYKTKGTEARPLLTITHYPELGHSKGIVLMKGEFSTDQGVVDAGNAQFLAFALQQFYATGDQAKLDLVHRFHTVPEQFDYQELIQEMERT